MAPTAAPTAVFFWRAVISGYPPGVVGTKRTVKKVVAVVFSRFVPNFISPSLWLVNRVPARPLSAEAPHYP